MMSCSVAARSGSAADTGWRPALYVTIFRILTNVAAPVKCRHAAWGGLVLYGETFGRELPSYARNRIFLRRINGSMFMGVNSKCAHQGRPPWNTSEQRA